MELGDIIKTTKVCKERECFECGEPAQYKHTYLLEGSRKNPQSNAYGRDDCSWCEDECLYACKEHKELVKKDYCPTRMNWCSTFPRERFEHMFLYWEETIKEKING